MDLLKKELGRKRKEIDSLQSVTTKKYLKRGEVEKLQLQQIKATDVSKKPENESSEQPVDHQKNSPEEELVISNDEVIKRLRNLSEPVRLFGESDGERLKRLRLLESREESHLGQTNELKKAMEVTDTQAILDLLRNDPNETGTSSLQKEAAFDQVDTSIVSLEMLENDPDQLRLLVDIFFKKLMYLWEKSLLERPDEVKQSTQGKLQTAIQKQSIEYMKPFFKQLKKGTLPPDVEERITMIVKYIHEREYQMANDQYLRLSIGNAPWPIGVTMVGIHERSARERISSSQVAHVLNDEKQRKWIQTIKRLITFAQTIYPPDDLSKIVG